MGIPSSVVHAAILTVILRTTATGMETAVATGDRMNT